MAGPWPGLKPNDGDPPRSRRLAATKKSEETSAEGEPGFAVRHSHASRSARTPCNVRPESVRDKRNRRAYAAVDRSGRWPDIRDARRQKVFVQARPGTGVRGRGPLCERRPNCELIATDQARRAHGLPEMAASHRQTHPRRYS